MTCKLELRLAAVVLPIILLCAIAGCGRRRTVTAGPPTVPPPAATIETTRPAPDARPDMPQPRPPRREVAILFKNAAGYTEVVSQLRKLLPVETYRLTV